MKSSLLPYPLFWKTSTRCLFLSRKQYDDASDQKENLARNLELRFYACFRYFFQLQAYFWSSSFLLLGLVVLDYLQLGSLSRFSSNFVLAAAVLHCFQRMISEINGKRGDDQSFLSPRSVGHYPPILHT